MEKMEHGAMAALLSLEPLGRLGLTDGRRPYVIPMPFWYCEEGIFVPFKLGGRKHQTVQSNTRACFEVDWSNSEMTEFCSVVVEGRLEAPKDRSEKFRAWEGLHGKYAHSSVFGARPEPVLAKEPEAKLLKLCMEEMSGRKTTGAKLDWLALMAEGRVWVPGQMEGN